MTATHTSQQLAKSIRIEALKMVHRANASHIGSCLSMADILAVLYGHVLRHDPKNPHWQERDSVILSKGHACAIMYAVLAQTGYFDKTLLETYGQNGTILQGHLSHHVPGVELSTGSLGHGLSVACGIAMAAKRESRRNRTFAILSDGELDEGSNWEAILFAGHHKLHNLTAIVDYNKIQSFGSVKEVLDLEPLADKWRACNWQVHDIDGHDHAALTRALGKNSGELPQVIIANTIKGKGVGFMEGKLEWHYKAPSAELLQQAIAEIEAAA
jgi:transketolase